MAQQTAVEWLVNYMLENFHLTDYTVMVVFEQAKQMEKEQMGYTKEDVLKAGEIGEINHYDYKHIVSLLDEAREINRQNK